MHSSQMVACTALKGVLIYTGWAKKKEVYKFVILVYDDIER